MSEVKFISNLKISSLPLYGKYDLLAQRVAMVFDYERNGFNFGQEEQKGSSGRKLSTRITCPVKPITQKENEHKIMIHYGNIATK